MPAKQKRFRDWCITDHDTSKKHVKSVRKALTDDDCVIAAIVTLEKGKKTEKKHLQVFIRLKNAKTMSACKKAYFGGKSHLEKRRGTPHEAWTYCEMECEPIFTKGVAPHPDEEAHATIWDQILLRIGEGASEWELMNEFPASYARYSTGIGKMMLLYYETNLLNRFREVSVTYLWGETGSGKTRSVLEADPGGVYRCSNYSNPFDGYRGQKTIVFEEFRSSLKVTDMLNYLDGYHCSLPCRYYDKVARWDKVYIVSNIPLTEQYESVQNWKPETWDAFRRRIDTVIELSLTKSDDTTEKWW